MTDVPALRAAVPVTVATPVPSGAANAAAALATVSVSSGPLPTALAQLGIGTVINGVVAERGPRGQVVVRTDKGAITLQSALPLRVGAAIALQIQSLGAQSQMMILSVDGQPLSGQNAAIVANAPKTASGPLPAAAQAPSAPAGQAKPLPLPDFGAKAAAMPQTSLNNAPPPTSLRPGVLTSGPLSPLPQAAAPASSPARPSAASLPAPVLPSYTDADNVAVRVLGLSPAPARTGAVTSLPELSPPRVAPGIVIAEDAVTFVGTVMQETVTESGQPTTLLRTPFGMLRLPLPAHEPPGSQLLLEMIASRAPQAVPGERLAQELGASRRLISLGQEWPALREAIDALENAAPEIAQQTLATTVPRVGPTLAAGLLMFIAAVRGGSLRQWLGETAIEALEHSGHQAAVGRLVDDFANLPRLAETQPNGWQTLLLPIFDGDKLRQIRMSMRRAPKDDGSGRKDGARFIIEAELSKLGPLQLDGLVRLPHFDLAVRTQENLPPDIRANIMEIFNDAMQATRLTGSVAFQTARDMRPGPFENWQSSGPGVTV